MERQKHLKKRDYFLDRLLSYRDSEPIKVVTGFRRCGKSSILGLLCQELRKYGIAEEQIIYISFELLQFRSMTYLELYDYVKAHVLPDRKMYFIFDEIQVVDHWEEAVNSLHTEVDADIYLSGSNARLLSSDLSTYLSGRHIELKMLPLSFNEFIRFHGYQMEQYTSPTGTTGIRILDAEKASVSSEEMLEAYFTFGGFPGLADFGFDREKAFALIDGIYNTVVVRDILEHENRKDSGERKATDPVLLKKIACFMADSIGSSISMNGISNMLVSQKELTNLSKQGKPAVATVQAYVNAFVQSYFFYPVDRYDIKGKEYLKTQKKYYIVDPGLRSYLLGYRGIDRGHLIENIVFLEFLRRGYTVSIGKIGSLEVDFIVERRDEKLYVQVTESLSDEAAAQRELAPLRQIRDSFPKIIISERQPQGLTEDGIEVWNLVDFLLGKS